jgi:hypothetical protein
MLSFSVADRQTGFHLKRTQGTLCKMYCHMYCHNIICTAILQYGLYSMYCNRVLPILPICQLQLEWQNRILPILPTCHSAPNTAWGTSQLRGRDTTRFPQGIPNTVQYGISATGWPPVPCTGKGLGVEPRVVPGVQGGSTGGRPT